MVRTSTRAPRDRTIAGGRAGSESLAASRLRERIVQAGCALLEDESDSSVQSVVYCETAAFRLTVNSEPHPGVLATVISPP